MKLAQLQALFSQHLLDPSIDLSELQISGPFAAKQLMNLYRNNFNISLSDYLTGCFPAVSALVGEEFFAQLARAYIVEGPLTQASLEFYGSGFATFVSTCPQTQSLEYLADVAALDWALDRAHSVQSFSDFPFAQLTKIDAEQQLQIIFKLQPETILISANYPLLKIWLGAKYGDLEHLNMTQIDYLIMHPDNKQGAKYYSLTAKQYQFLAAVAAGEKLQMLTAQPDFQAQLNHFISENVINDFKLEGEI